MSMLYAFSSTTPTLAQKSLFVTIKLKCDTTNDQQLVKLWTGAWHLWCGWSSFNSVFFKQTLATCKSLHVNYIYPLPYNCVSWFYYISWNDTIKKECFFPAKSFLILILSYCYLSTGKSCVYRIIICKISNLFVSSIIIYLEYQ